MRTTREPRPAEHVASEPRTTGCMNSEMRAPRPQATAQARCDDRSFACAGLEATANERKSNFRLLRNAELRLLQERVDRAHFRHWKTEAESRSTPCTDIEKSHIGTEAIFGFSGNDVEDFSRQFHDHQEESATNNQKKHTPNKWPFVR